MIHATGTTCAQDHAPPFREAASVKNPIPFAAISPFKWSIDS